MRNKDVLKKLKNLPDNTKEYIDTNEFVKIITDFEITSTGKVAKIYTDSLTAGRRYRFPFESYPNLASAAIIKKYDDGTTKTITTIRKSTDYIYVSAIIGTFDIYHRSAVGTMSRVNGSFGTTSSEYTSTVTKVVLDTLSDRLFEPTKDYHPATKKYVDDATNTLVKKDTNKYILITNDDTLVIKKASITDIADATVTIDNLTGQFGALVANDDSTYSYTLNTIMTDVETFTFKVNNVEQKLVIVPYKEMTYDDKNAGITYEGNWYEDTNDKYYKKSSHYSKGTDNSVSKLSFIFTGTAVRFIGMTSKALGQNNIRSQIFIVNSDGSVGTTASYTSVSDNKISSTDDILYNTSLVYNNIDNKFGYGKYKSVLTSGKGSSTYVDKIIIYNTIQKLNNAIESLYNQKEATPTVLRTDIPNTKFEPKELYDPATKCYVDKTVAASTVNMCTDEEVDNMLNEVLGGDYSGN